MTTSKPNSQTSIGSGDNIPSRSLRTVESDHSGWILLAIIVLVIGGAAFAFAQEPDPSSSPPPYRISFLPRLGGTNSGATGINERGWVAGYSTLPTDQIRHAAFWRNRNVATDLGTLGGPNSTSPFNGVNDRGVVVGISQTSTPETRGELWSSFFFYGGPYRSGLINLGFVWENNRMRPLPTLGTQNNGFAASLNNRNVAVGWAENNVEDTECVAPQVLQFRPVSWDLNHGDLIRELPLFESDTSGAATAINDDGQIAGISGICDQAIGRYTAKHAVVWNGNQVTDIGNLGALWWNTPTCMNEHGDVAGFAGDPAFPEGDYLHAFIWTREGGLRPLGALPNRTPEHVHSEAYGINDRREVVGISCDAAFEDCRAFVWKNGVMRDLNTPGTTPNLILARDINDEGEITGRGLDSTGLRAAFVAKPTRDHDDD